MKLRNAIAGVVCSFVFSQFSTQICSQPATPNRVLELDGNGSYVELPRGLFTNEVITVEGWVMWRSFRGKSRFFELTDEVREVAVNLRPNGVLFIDQPTRTPGGPITGYQNYHFPGLVRSNQWCHLAVVCRSNACKLYFNGVPMAASCRTRSAMRAAAIASKTFRVENIRFVAWSLMDTNTTQD